MALFLSCSFLSCLFIPLYLVAILFQFCNCYIYDFQQPILCYSLPPQNALFFVVFWICTAAHYFIPFGIISLIILDLSYCLFSAFLSAFLLECCFAFIFQKYFLWNAVLLDLNFLSIFVEMLLFLLFHFHILEPCRLKAAMLFVYMPFLLQFSVA